MKLDIPDEDLDLMIKALDHYHAYTVVRKAEDAKLIPARIGDGLVRIVETARVHKRVPILHEAHFCHEVFPNTDHAST